MRHARRARFLSLYPRLLGLVALCLLIGLKLTQSPVAAEPSRNSDPNAACAPCHRALYDRYRQTPMANASGAATDGAIPADFYHAPSDVHYRVYEENSAVWLTYKREDPARKLDGRRQLLYYIGSGRRGRTYLFQQDGYWFEAPINWYAKKRVWDMAPNYQSARTMPLTLPVDPGCLKCHASGAASSLPDARNHYAANPFAQAGITCAACHGDTAAHVASHGTVKLANLDALPPVERDSICLNCHLEGQVSITRRTMAPEKFKPGQNLFDYSLFFVHRSEVGSGGRATSQYEALLKSACKQQSGDRITCTTCHDPHGGPPPAQRVAFYRSRCLQCHSAPGFAASHHPDKPDCITCHMGKPSSSDIAHEQVTDHWIRRHASEDSLPRATAGELVPVGGVKASNRDLGMAYAEQGLHGDQPAAEKALQLLSKAEKESGAQNDAQLHERLGLLRQLNQQDDRAEAQYREALHIDPYDEVAAGDLALLNVKKHQYGEALRLWEGVMERDPAQGKAGVNLAVLEKAAGRSDQARKVLEEVLRFDPDNEKARAMEAEMARTNRVYRAR